MDTDAYDTNGEAPELNITAQRVSDSQSIVTVRLSAEVLLVDKLDVTKAKQRSDFVGKLCEGRNGIDPRAVESLLMQVAATQVDQKSEPAPAVPSREALLAKLSPLACEQARSMLNDPLLLKLIL